MHFSHVGDADLTTIRAFALERAAEVARTCVEPAVLSQKGAGETVLELAGKFENFILSGGQRAAS